MKVKTEYITKIAYKFDELSNEAKEHAISNLCDINTDWAWWDFFLDSAESELGVKITSFDFGRSWEISLKRKFGVHETIQKIIDGQFSFLGQLIRDYYSDKRGDYWTGEMFDQILGEYILEALRDEYEYLNSEETIAETIRANDYDFDTDGNLI